MRSLWNSCHVLLLENAYFGDLNHVESTRFGLVGAPGNKPASKQPPETRDLAHLEAHWTLQLLVTGLVTPLMVSLAGLQWAAPAISRVRSPLESSYLQARPLGALGLEPASSSAETDVQQREEEFCGDSQ